MSAYADGETAAFDELFRRYAQVLARVLRRNLSKQEDASDLVQQTFLQVHRHRKDYDPHRRFRPWLFTIAFNLRRDYYRRSNLRRESPLGESALEPLVHDERSKLEARRSVEVALGALSEEQRDVIALHWLGGVPLPEVAEIVGASLSAVKVRAHRGYAAMRSHLGSESPSAVKGQPSKHTG